MKLNKYDLIKAPVVTEKAMNALAHQFYVFRVMGCATKTEIKKTVESIYAVKVTKVNTLVRKGKKKIFKGRPGYRSDEKYAYVQLSEGQTIDLSTEI